MVSSIVPPTSSFGVSSHIPAKGAGVIGVSHVQVDNTSPSSCASTAVLEVSVTLSLVISNWVCEVVLQTLLCVHALHI